MGNLQKKAVSGIAWNIAQKFASTGLSFIFMIFLTRLLTPADYGMIGMLSVFMMLSQTFIDCGFGQALIRKQNRTSVDESTVFYFNMGASIVCYLILFLIAPWVADFYNMPVLKDILRVQGLTLVIGAFSMIQSLLFTINLDFKTSTLISLGANALSGAVAVILAYRGWGVWALVAQSILGTLFRSVAFMLLSKWHPIWAFSIKTFKEMFSFGSKLLGTSLLNVFYNRLSPIVIGKFYSAADLGLFSKSDQLATFPGSVIYSSLYTVAYPVLCKMQSDQAKLTLAYQKMVGVISFVVTPLMITLSIFATPLLKSLFGEQWLGASPFLSILCLPWIIVPVQCLNLSLLEVIGRTDLLLRLEIIGKVIGFTTLLMVLPISVMAVCIGCSINAYLCLFINLFYTGKYINYPLLQQFRDILKPLLPAVLAAFSAYFAVLHFDSAMLQVIIGFSLSGIIYLLIASLFRMRELKDIVDIIRQNIS